MKIDMKSKLAALFFFCPPLLYAGEHRSEFDDFVGETYKSFVSTEKGAESNRVAYLITDDESGMLSKLAFSVAKLQSQRPVAGGGNRMQGINVITSEMGIAEDNNNVAFVKGCSTASD
jgi:hypothetical protein